MKQTCNDNNVKQLVFNLGKSCMKPFQAWPHAFKNIAGCWIQQKTFL